MNTYEVFYAIYSWNINETTTCLNEDVLSDVQTQLNNPDNDGVINVNINAFGGDPSPGNDKVFVTILKINFSDEESIIKLCVCKDNVNLNVNDSGIVLDNFFE
jgi:hypothetical protein